MQKNIYLTGFGQTAFGEHWHMGIRDMMEEAIQKAIVHAGMISLDIDTIIVGNMLGEATNAQAHLGALASSLLPHRPPAIRTEAACASGSVALHTACALLESGRAETILVVGVEKMTDVSTDDINQALMGAGDSEKDHIAGMTFAGIFGLIAARYMYDYGLTRDALSMISTRHHELAKHNAFAQFRNAITPEMVTQSTPVSQPLNLLDCSPISDGAAACILSTTRKSDLQIRATSLRNDALSITDRESLTSFPASREAMSGALAEAQLTLDDIDVVEMHDCFSIAALINLEDLGFAEPGEGIRYYESTETPMSINASGGLKACGHPVGATGVKQLIDVGKELRQSHKRYGVSHNLGGIGATAVIHILERTS